MEQATSRDPAQHATGQPKLYLLWRQSLAEVLARARQAAEPATLVRLVTDPLDASLLEAVRRRSWKLVTLPVAFAGLREHDAVLRQAVQQGGLRLQPALALAAPTR